MLVKNTEIENGAAKVQVELTGVEFENALTKAYLKAKKNIFIPGFRKGKAPRKIVEAMYGAEIFYEDAIEEIFPEIYTTAVVDNKLKAVGRPGIAGMEKTEDGGMLITVSTDLYPEAVLGEYKGMEVPKAEAAVTDEEVEAKLNTMAEQNSRISTVDRQAQNGDTVVLDFEGFVDGVPFDGGKGEKFDLKLGSGSFVPGFEEQLVGISAGEAKDVVVTFPENYTKELASKEATFKCFVHEVKETILPEIDDEFAKDVSEFDTIDELRADIRAKELADKQAGIDNAFRNACVEKAVEGMQVTIPESMIEEQLDKEMDNFAYQVEQNGMTMENYVKMLGGDESKLRATFRPLAERNAKSEILLSKIIEVEGIEVTDEEVDAEIAKMAEQYSMDAETIRKSVPAENIRYDLKTRKAVDLLVAAAVPVAPKADTEAAAE